MSELITLARPYAKAAFDVALETSQVEAWLRGLQELAALFHEEALDEALSLPTLPEEEAVALVLSLSPTAKAVEGIESLLAQLAQNGRLGLVPQLSELFGRYHDEWASSISVNIVSARELSPEAQSRFEAALETRLQRKIKVTSEVDSTLIGGAIVRAGDLVMDGSVRGRLEKLSEQLLAS